MRKLQEQIVNMGIQTYVKVVKNVINFGSLTKLIKSELTDDEFDEYEDSAMFIFRGWKVKDTCHQLGDLITTTVVKGNHTVHLVNTDQYAAVGEEDYVAFSNSRRSVLTLMSDWGIKGKISSSSIVQQTL